MIVLLLSLFAVLFTGCGEIDELFVVTPGNDVFVGWGNTKPVVNPPETNLPDVEPPADEPPAVDQTADEPPVSEPPADEASATDLLSEDASPTDLPADEPPADETIESEPFDLSQIVYTGYAAEYHPQYIVHAGGEYHKYAVTNSIDSFTMAYQAGQRYLEIDFNLTSDGEPVCIHDWNTDILPEYTASDFPLSLEEFEGAALCGFMTTMTAADLAGFMENHSDFYVITDGKYSSLTILQLLADRYPHLQNRFIVQVYNTETITVVQSMGYSRIILTLYELPNEVKTNPDVVAELVKAYDLWAITFPVELTAYDGYVNRLLMTGNRLYSHTVNDKSKIEEQLAMGITGVYTDQYFE